MNDSTRDDRKRLLDDARRALRSGDARQMRAALERLPASGTKAEALRRDLRARLASGPSVIALPLPLASRTTRSLASAAVQATVGLRYRFVISRAAHSTLFRVRPHGAVVEIAINSSHPAFSYLATSDGGDIKDFAKSILIAWAILHLEAGSDKKREKVDDLAAEWARALGSLRADTATDETLG